MLLLGWNMTESDRNPDGNAFTEWLADHPRFMGALFVTLVLLSKAGTVAANYANATNGP